MLVSKFVAGQLLLHLIMRAQWAVATKDASLLKTNVAANRKRDCSKSTVFNCSSSAYSPECIQSTLKCNGVSECSNGWDENVTTCGCLENEFKCNSTTCIPSLHRCDGITDCINGRDEQHCETYTCPSLTHCKCDNHLCVPCDVFCDFRNDCGDNSDEKNCQYRQCYDTEIRCANSECIAPIHLCDGQVNCFDGSDEIGCDRHLACENGFYVHDRQICDGWIDCLDSHYDEINCGNCSVGQYRCTNGRCISKYNVCDLECDCAGSCDDERGCGDLSCDMSSHFRCYGDPTNPGRCISRKALCNGRNECWNNPVGSDEKFCLAKTSCDPHREFRCSDGRCIPLTLTCDHQADCQHGEDETQCSFLPCSEEQYRCKNNQCVHIQNRCDAFADCFDGSDEMNCENFQCPDKYFKCKSGQCITIAKVCDYRGQCPDFSDETDCDGVYRDCTSSEFRCHSGQCIPEGDRCFKDKMSKTGCTDGSHLINCTHWQCTEDRYKCTNSYCIRGEQVCDNIPDCIISYSDERNSSCSYNCPLSNPVCSCLDEIMNCTGLRLKSVPTLGAGDMTSKVFMSGNLLNFSLSNMSFRGMERTTLLDLSSNSLSVLPSSVFMNLWRLESLNLRENNITTLSQGAFRGLTNLKILLIHGNEIGSIRPFAFLGLSKLHLLDLSDQNMSAVRQDGFTGLHSLIQLNLSHNHITVIENGAFNSLQKLQELDISGNQINIVGPYVFNDLPKLKRLITDEYRFCCLVPQVNSCTPDPDEFSSCEDLMSNVVLRVSIWVIGMIASFGNIHVIGWRAREINKSRAGKVHSFFITNLAIADLCMGIYLILIASVDSYYRGTYIVHDTTWRASSLCKLAGFMSTFSSELSVLILTAITADRLIVIIFPFKKRHMKFSTATAIMASLWAAVLALSVIPLTGIEYFEGFYGRSAVCLPLHITPKKLQGWEYSVFIFLGLNSLSCLFVAGSYITMYWTARNSQLAVRSRESQTDNAMAKRMTVIVLTDFLCWIPIIFLGVSSLAGLTIHPQVYAWIAVFVLPLNSAINPLLYTLTTAPFLNKIQRGNFLFRRSFGSSAYCDTRESYALESAMNDHDQIRDPQRARESIRLREMSVDHEVNDNNTEKNKRFYSLLRRYYSETDSDI